MNFQSSQQFWIAVHLKGHYISRTSDRINHLNIITALSVYPISEDETQTLEGKTVRRQIKSVEQKSVKRTPNNTAIITTNFDQEQLNITD